MSRIDLTKPKPVTPASAFMEMLGGGDTTKNIENISISKLTPFPDQKIFHRYNGTKLEEFIKDIRKNGVLQPCIVRPYEDGGETLYQILAGHSRTEAAKLAGLDTVPCIIRDCDDKTAREIFVMTNLNQREHLMPSEKAFAYKLLLESDDDKSAEKIAQQNSESRRQVFRYLRLTHLIEPLLKMVDAAEIPLIAGVNLSCLDAPSQVFLLQYVTANKLKIRLCHSEMLKNLGSGKALTTESLDCIFSAKERRKHQMKLPVDDLRPFFTGLDDKQMAEKIIAIVKEHFLEKQNG